MPKKGLDKFDIRTIQDSIDFYTGDIDGFKVMRDHADLSKLEVFRLNNAIYALESAQEYLKEIITQFEEDEVVEGIVEELEELKEPNVTFVTIKPDKLKSESGSTSGVKVTVDEKDVWKPEHKDPEKIRAAVLEVLDGVTEVDESRPGFIGWLTAEVSSKFKGKGDPGQILSVIKEIEIK
jgi:hypothetical protein